MRLALSLATRNRPELLLRTIMVTVGNIRNPDTVLMIAADEDDEPTIDFLKNIGESGLYPKLKISIRPREDTVAAKWNRAIEEIPDADVYMPMCDDGPIITPAFDDKVLEAAAIPPDGIAFVYNRMENASFPGIQAVTREVIDLMDGQIYVPLFPYWFVDHWLDDIAKVTDRIFFCDVDHDADTNRPPTMEMREPGWWATFFDACFLKRRAMALKIVDATMDTTWRKAQLKRNLPLHEYRSKWVNDCVRDNHGLAEYAKRHAPDDRYRRIRASAVAMMRDELLPMLKAEGLPMGNAAPLPLPPLLEVSAA